MLINIMDQEIIHDNNFFEPIPLYIDEMVRIEKLEQIKMIAENMKDLKEMIQMTSHQAQ